MSHFLARHEEDRRRTRSAMLGTSVKWTYPDRVHLSARAFAKCHDLVSGPDLADSEVRDGSGKGIARDQLLHSSLADS
jgi:hypothetical protein